MARPRGSWGFRAVFLAILACEVACAYRTPAVHVPPSLDGAASVSADDIAVFDAVHGGDPDNARAVRDDTAKILAGAFGGSSADAKTAAGSRVKVRVEILESEDDIYAPSLARDGCAAMGMIGVPAGQVIDRETVRVDVTLERSGRTFVGRATAEKEGSLYAHAQRRALAAALDRALADAARENE